MKKPIKYSLILLLAGIFTASIYFAIAGMGGANSSGLVLYYDMDDNNVNGTTIYDKSGNGNNGTLGDGVTPTTYPSSAVGKLKEARSFDGGDYIDGGNGASLNITGSFSLEVWVKRGSIGAEQYIISKERPETAGYGIYFDSNNKLILLFGDGGWQNTRTSSVFDSTSNWYHIVGTHISGTQKIFVNGIEQSLEAGGAISSNPSISSNNLRIGAYSGGEYFSGLIDSPRIYSRALSATEVLQNYNSTKRNYVQTSNNTGLVGYWNMDNNDINGATLYDKSGNGNNGTIVGATAGAEGKIGQALSFDGDGDYVMIHYSSTLAPTNYISFGCWAYKSSWIVENKRIISKTESGGYHLGIGDANYPSDIGVLVRRNGSYGIASYAVSSLSSGWHYFFGTYDGRYTKFYVDGILRSTNDAGGSYSIQYTYNNALLIGAEAVDGELPAGNYFSGLIDDVRIYNRALSADEVLQSYNGSKRTYIQAQNNTGLVGQWSLGTADISGATVYGKGTSDQMTAVASPTLTTGFDGRANQALSFNGTTQYLTQKVHDTKQGTVTASMAATVGFINDSTQDFSPYVGASGSSKPYMLVATDSTGKKAWGYIGEQGAGETLGSEMHTSANAASDPMGNEANATTGWVLDYGTIVSNDVSPWVGLYHLKMTGPGPTMYQNFTTVAGRVYKASFAFKVVSGTSNRIRIYDTNTSGTSLAAYLSSGPEVYADHNLVFTALTTISLIDVYSNVTAEMYFDNLSLKQVLTPTTSGVKIYSTKTGSTQSWANVETGFNANSVPSYEIRKTDFQISGVITVGAWVKTSGTGTIIGKLDAAAYPNFGYYIDVQSGGYPRFGIGAPATDYQAQSDNNKADNTWHFIMGVFNPSVSVSLYVDGVLDKINTTSIPATTNDVYLPLRIGVRTSSGSLNSFFPGSIDEPVIYNRALSAAEVLGLYNSQKKFFIN